VTITNNDPLNEMPDDWNDDSGGLGKVFAEAALSIFTLHFQYAVLPKIIYDHFSKHKRELRIKKTLTDTAKALEKIEKDRALDRDTLSEIQAQIEGPEFKDAFVTACEESVRAANEKKVDQFISVLAGSLTPSQWSSKDEDVATLIRDLAQLGDRDIQVLQVLSFAFKGLMSQPSSMSDNYLFTNNNECLEREIEKQTLIRDDFYSTCCRLIGFGLAIEEPWPMTRSQPHGRCIRPTRRGLALLEYIQRLT
jgi:hypothetical protein